MQRHRIVAGLLSSILFASALAQQSNQTSTSGEIGLEGQQSASSTLHVTTRLVVLDVTVTDRLGHLINNLPKDAFQLYEDKVPQRVRSFEQPTAQTPAAIVPVDSTAALDRLEPSAPVSILVLDEINTRSEDESFARYSLKKYLETQGDQLQQPTLLIAVNTSRLTVLHDYTTSRAKLLDAISTN